MKINKKHVKTAKKVANTAFKYGGKFLDAMEKASKNIQKNQKKKKGKNLEFNLPDL